MAEIKCPMCSKPNPEELDVCQFCEARLKPLTAELSDSQSPIHAGEEPKAIDTSQLESELPQWLREVRQQARDSAEQEPEAAPAQAPVEEEAVPPEEAPDLLAGLQSQSEGEEEIPDWLSSLRGETAQTTPEEVSTEDEDLAALKSMLGEETTEDGYSETDEVPGLIADIETDQIEGQVGTDELSNLLTGNAAEEESIQPEAESTASESDFEWGADFEADSGLRAESIEDAAPIDTELPDWLKGTDERTGGEPESDLTDWMKTEESDQAMPSLESEETSEFALDETVQPAAEGDLPSWLASLGQETTEGAQEEEAQTVAESDTQDWLASLDKAEAASEESVQPAAEGDLPDWLSSLGTDSAEAVPEQEAGEPAAAGETPDWLASMSQETPELEDVSDELEFPALISEEPAQEEGVAPSEVTDDGQGALTPADDIDALFAMDMPEWLSDAGAQESEGQALETPAEGAVDDLRPAELPSWVQAMRPVEDVISETDEGTVADQPVEEEGPLAGLRGVLPAVPGVGPTSKPKAYSIKLQASEDQQTSAAMLEQMLAAEAQPEPITTQPIVLPQRFLRWIITIVLFLVVGVSVFTGMQINPIPSGVPPATKAFLEDYVQGSLLADAPVLMIFDYDAALAGELEASAAPLIDYMILQKAPRLSLISSNPLGSGLAEQFMSLENTQASLYYQAGQQFINLGYLPGGPAGVLAFAEDPKKTKPFSIDGESAWETPVLQGVSRLSDFAAIILLTDNMETARIWIEQTEVARENAHFLVVSSAQSGPMILPYHQSGQVDVMLTGLDGGAPIEQFNGGRPGTARRYWDAYGMGLLATLVMISFGSLWSLLAGLRERSKEQGEA